MTAIPPAIPPADPSQEPPVGTSSAESEPATSPTWRTWAGAAAAAAVVVAAGVYAMGRGGDDTAAVSAAETDQTDQTDGAAGTGPVGGPGGFGRGASGEVIEVDGGSLTLESIDQAGSSSTLTVEITGDTTITETVEGELSDLAVGDDVVVMGDETDGGVEATSISEALGDAGFGGGAPPDGAGLPEGVDPPEGFDPGDAPQGGAFPGGLTIGEITAIDGSTLTVETAQGESINVTVTDTTTITISEDRSVDDIEVGDTVRANGEIDGSVVTATSIQLGDLGSGGFGGGGSPGGPPASDDDSTS